jgi:hypothetical protein
MPVVGTIAFSVSSCLAQAAPPAEPSVQTPTPAQPGSYPAAPAYGGGITQGTAAPAPAVVDAPVVAPAPTTANAPVGAMPAYASPERKPFNFIPYRTPEDKAHRGPESSVYIPMDSWVYPAMSRLYSLGYADEAFMTMRPWTRLGLLHVLDATQNDIVNGDNEEAQGILTALQHELREETAGSLDRGTVYGMQSAYTRVMGISGTTLRDSYHLGQTLENDYGRPYQPGFNNLTGFSGLAEKGRFSLYLRGEYQHAPGAEG